jgi:hypothetical protein
MWLFVATAGRIRNPDWKPGEKRQLWGLIATPSEPITPALGENCGEIAAQF